jgi:hypothetical protein
MGVPGTMLAKLGLSRVQAEDIHLAMTQLIEAAQVDHTLMPAPGVEDAAADDEATA